LNKRESSIDDAQSAAMYYDNVGFYNGVFWADPRTITSSLDCKL
jgi:hypothetical protein